MPESRCTSTVLNSFISLKFRPENPFYGRAASEVIFWGHFYEAAQRPKRFFLPPLLSLLSRGRRVVVVYQENYANLCALGFRAWLCRRCWGRREGRRQGEGGRREGQCQAVRATCARETGGCFETAVRNNWTFLWLLCARP